MLWWYVGLWVCDGLFWCSPPSTQWHELLWSVCWVVCMTSYHLLSLFGWLYML
jgi:hypothetical protein